MLCDLVMGASLRCRAVPVKRRVEHMPRAVHAVEKNVEADLGNIQYQAGMCHSQRWCAQACYTLPNENLFVVRRTQRVTEARVICTSWTGQMGV